MEYNIASVLNRFYKNFQENIMRTTIKDIAKHVGVSKATISLCLNKHPLSAHIAEKTKKKIDEAVEMLDYHPSNVARSLVKGRSRTIGLMVGSLANPYYSFFTSKFLEALLKQNYQLLISVSPGSKSADRKAFMNLLNHQVDGIISAYALRPDASMKKTLEGIPVLQLYSPLDEYNSHSVVWKSVNHKICQQVSESGYKGICWIDMVEFHEFEQEHAACKTYGLNCLVLDVFLTPEQIFEEAEKAGTDVIVVRSSIFLTSLLHARDTQKIGENFVFINDYSLPFDYIDHSAIIGCVFNNFEANIQNLVGNILHTVKNPKECNHWTHEPEYCNKNEIEEIFYKQLQDPYYRDIAGQIIQYKYKPEACINNCCTEPLGVNKRI